MNNKTELIQYFINKLNALDLSSVKDEDGITVYGSNPFVPVIFKQLDSGGIKTVPVSEIIAEQEEIKRIIYVGFNDTAELEKENIREIGANPLESWIGTVQMSFMLDIDNERVFDETYSILQDFQENSLRYNTEVLTIFGKERSIEVQSQRLFDVTGTIRTLNSVDYKDVQVTMLVQVSSKGLVKGSRRRFEIDGEPIPAQRKGFVYEKIIEDDTKSGNAKTGYFPDTFVRTITFNLPFDYDLNFIKKLYSEVTDTGTESKIDQTYSVKSIYELPDGTKLEETYIMIIENYTEEIAEQGLVVLTINMKET